MVGAQARALRIKANAAAGRSAARSAGRRDISQVNPHGVVNGTDRDGRPSDDEATAVPNALRSPRWTRARSDHRGERNAFGAAVAHHKWGLPSPESVPFTTPCLGNVATSANRAALAAGRGGRFAEGTGFSPTHSLERWRPPLGQCQRRSPARRDPCRRPVFKISDALRARGTRGSHSSRCRGRDLEPLRCRVALRWPTGCRCNASPRTDRSRENEAARLVAAADPEWSCMIILALKAGAGGLWEPHSAVVAPPSRPCDVRSRVSCVAAGAEGEVIPARGDDLRARA